MENNFTVLSHPYRMRETNSLGADVRIQQTRKAYFTRVEGIGEGEMRSSVRDRFSDWMASVEDTSLEDILTVCALLEPVEDSPYLTPEYILNAPRFGGILEEIRVAINFFMLARETSRLELLASSKPSETITEASTPATESSTPESTSP